jgi:hypothetical protein
MSSRRILIGCLLLGPLLLVGCARGELVCLKNGGDAWHEVRSENFVLKTNLDKGDAISRSRELEKMHRALAYVVQIVLPSTLPPTDPIEIIHFADRLQLQEFVGETTGGFMSKRQGYVVIASSESSSSKYRDSLLKHELTHRFVAHQMVGYPTWLTEGLAGFFETLRFQGQQAIVGDFPLGHTRRWLGNTAFLPSVKALQAMGPGDFYKNKTKSNNYFAAWRLVHFLTNEDPVLHKRFRYYTASLAAGIPAEQAWEMSFGGAGDINGKLRGYRGKRSIKKWAIDYKSKRQIDPEVRKLRDGEVHVLWARMSYLRSGPRGELAVKNSKRRFIELANASDHDPQFEATKFWNVRLSDGDDAQKKLGDLRGYVAKNQDDTRALHLLVSMEMEEAGSPSGASTGQKLSALEPLVNRLIAQAKHGRELNMIAWYYALTQNPQEGLPYAVRAVKREPSSAASLDTYALLLYQSNRPDLALIIQSRAVELYGERGRIPSTVAARLLLYKKASAEKPTS